MKPLVRIYRAAQRGMERKRMRNGRGGLFGEGLAETYDLPYLPDGDPRHTLDVIGPAEEGRLPVIVEIHGGGYAACEKKINRLHCRAFAQQGFRVVNGEYTLFPEGDFGTELREIGEILRWIPAHAEEYGLDAERVFLTGDSAGGHLVLLWAMLMGNPALRGYYGVTLPETEVRAVAPSCPAIRFREHPEEPLMKLLNRMAVPRKAGKDFFEKSDVLRLMKDSAYPPLIVTATPEDTLLYAEDKLLGAALAETGRPFEYREYVGRSRKLEHVFHVLYPEWEESREANGDIAAFFRKYC